MRVELEQEYKWVSHKDGPTEPVRSPREFVETDDESLRDGLQGVQLDVHPSTGQKKIFLQAVSEFVEHADIGFPGSEEDHQKELEELIKYVQERHLPITLSAAGRGAARSDIEPIVELSHKTGYPLEADIFLDGSKNRSQVQGWDRSDKFKQLEDNITFLKANGLPVMFVAERATDTTPEDLFELFKIAAESGVDRLCIADTQGIARDGGVSNIIRWGLDNFAAKYPDMKWDAHFHNDRGLAVSNCITAAEEGIDRVHTTVFCLGERAGNADLAHVLLNFNMMGLRDDDLSGLVPFTEMAADLLKYTIPNNTPVYGASAHKTASGVHASALLSERNSEIDHRLYFAYPPTMVGAKAGVEIGPFSGAANVKYKLQELGIPLSEDKISEILNEAKKSRGILPDSTIRQIVKRNGKNARQPHEE